jgi:hypothetical protein
MNATRKRLELEAVHGRRLQLLLDELRAGAAECKLDMADVDVYIRPGQDITGLFYLALKKKIVISYLRTYNLAGCTICGTFTRQPELLMNLSEPPHARYISEKMQALGVEMGDHRKGLIVREGSEQWDQWIQELVDRGWGSDSRGAKELQARVAGLSEAAKDTLLGRRVLVVLTSSCNFGYLSQLHAVTRPDTESASRPSSSTCIRTTTESLMPRERS